MIKKLISLFTRKLTTDAVLRDFDQVSAKLAKVIAEQTESGRQHDELARHHESEARAAEHEALRADRVAHKIAELLA